MPEALPIVYDNGELKQRPIDSVVLTGTTMEGRRNSLLNSAFSVWQRGTTFSNVAHGAYTADRWRFDRVTTGSVRLSRVVDSPTPGQSGLYNSYALRAECTTADTSVASTDYAMISQIIEGYYWEPLWAQKIVLSFWVKSSKTGVYAVALSNNGGDRTFVSQYSILASNVWEKKVIKIPASPQTGTWQIQTGRGLWVSFCLMAGSNFQTSTLDAWDTSYRLSGTSQVNFLDSTSNDFRVTLVQLEPGDVATPFNHRRHPQELLDCWRYYWKTFIYETAPAQNTGQFNGAALNVTQVGGLFATDLRFPIAMRTLPTLQTYNPVANNDSWRDFIYSTDRAVLIGTWGSTHVIISGGVLSQDNSNMYIHLTADAEL